MPLSTMTPTFYGWQTLPTSIATLLRDFVSSLVALDVFTHYSKNYQHTIYTLNSAFGQNTVTAVSWWVWPRRGSQHSCILSPTLFLLHINDLFWFISYVIRSFTNDSTPSQQHRLCALFFLSTFLLQILLKFEDWFTRICYTVEQQTYISKQKKWNVRRYCHVW